MEELIKYNDLVLTKVFNCSTCGEIMITPIWLTQEQKNICNICYQKLENKNDILENVPLSNIIKQMYIPCPNKNEGCMEVMPYNLMKDHKPSCICTRQLPCAVYTCKWEGTPMVAHLVSEHAKLLCATRGESFTLSTPPEDKDKYDILQTIHGCYVVRTKVVSNKLKFAIYDCHNVWYKLGGQLLLQYEHSSDEDEEDDEEVTVICSVIKHTDVSHFREFSDKFISVVEFAPRGSKVPAPSTIKLIFKAREESILPKSLEELFYCMDCKETSRKVFTCPNEHTFCKDHARFHIDCGPHSSDPVQALFGEDYLFPCTNSLKGCRVFVSVNSKHEKLCRSYYLRCPVKSCDYDECQYQYLASHIQHRHEDLCIERNFAKFTCDKDASTEHVFLIFNRIFKCIFEVKEVLAEGRRPTKHFSWKVVGVHLGAESRDFVFTVGLIAQKTCRKLILSENCDERETDSEGIVLDSKQMNGFYSSKLDYYIRITHGKNFHDINCDCDICVRTCL